MFPKSVAFAAAIILCAFTAACMTPSASGKPGMMNRMASMECKQAAQNSQHEKNDSPSEDRADKHEAKRAKKSGCPMMAAKVTQADSPTSHEEDPENKDPHAEHRR